MNIQNKEEQARDDSILYQVHQRAKKARATEEFQG